MNNLQKIAFENSQAVTRRMFLILFSPILLIAVLTIYPQSARLPGGADHPSLRLNLLLSLEKCWIYPGALQPDLNIASDNAKELYIPLLEGKLISLDSQTGKKKWETELGGTLGATPLSDTANVYTASVYTGGERGVNESGAKAVVRSLNKITGIPIWETELPSVSKIHTLALPDVLLAVGSNGFVFSVRKIDGRINWSRNLSAEPTAVPFLSNNQLLLGFNRRIIILSPDSGRITVELQLVNRPTAILKNENDRVGDNVFWGDEKGFLVSFNIRLKKVNWRVRKGAQISKLVLTDSGLLVISQDDFVYLVSEKSGSLIWKKRFGNRISSEPLILDNYAVLTTVADSSALIVELQSGTAVNAISLSADTFLTSDVKQTAGFLAFAGSKGIFAFSNRGICPDLHKIK